MARAWLFQQLKPKDAVNRTAGSGWMVYGVAIGLPGDERDVFLDRECGGDAGVRAQVVALLAPDARAQCSSRSCDVFVPARAGARLV